MSQYKYLFTPIRLGPVRLRNRVVFAAHLTNFAQHNRPSQQLIDYYRERARGGAGLIITEEQSVHVSDFAYEKLIHAYDASVIPDYRRLTDAVKSEGAAVFCQLNHNGLQGFSFFNDEPLWGPSPVGDALFREIPSAADEEQIAQLVEGYARVAAHVREGGFDGVELQASHSSILRQFLSPYSNKREDAYGGTLEGRMKLVVDVLHVVREALGGNLAMGIRLCTDELLDGGLVLSEVVEIARRLDALGVLDFINTSIGTTGKLYMVEGPMSVPAGYQSGHTAAVREAVAVPVIAVGRINDPQMADRLLADGVADLVGVVRGQISDPQWAIKSEHGQAAEIRKCIACNQYCIGLMGLNAPLSCIQNPANGEEGRLGMDSYHPTDNPKRVLVIGGGPAGMEAAIVAAGHGHKVTLYEREQHLGGNVNHIIKTASRSEYGDLIRNKTGELQRHGVELLLGVEMSEASILAEAPGVVILATGQEELPPSHIPGMEGQRVRTPIDILNGTRPEPCHVMIIDDIGFHQATSLVEYLAEGGCRISMITSAFCVGQELGVTLDLELWHQRVAHKALDIYEGHVVLSVEGDPLLLDIYANRQFNLQGVDLIVPVNFGRSRADLFPGLEGRVPELHRVGDALAPKDVGEAILDGHRAARMICGMDMGWQ
ncbi:MAG: mycofactocin system FadH/OYE family oxidoreductase 2 [SAR324 cluster bacterium]|nr:mycofactocin system FadH/OYE family oxidoreductase 2 [SAR324 cluster bacterium]